MNISMHLTSSLLVAVKVDMKRKARDSQDSSHHIEGEGLETVTEGTAAELPQLGSLKRTIQLQQAAPVQPATLEQLTLPEEYKRTSIDDQFLLYDGSCGTEDPHLRNVTEPGNVAADSVWLADGTFKTAPSLSRRYT